MKCDKYKKKLKIVLFMFSPIILIFIYNIFFILNKDIVRYLGFYGFFVSFGGLTIILPYIKCIVNYNQSHKPPYK